MKFSDDANPKDPREKPVPPRPKGQRPEPESTGGSTFGGFGGFGGGGKIKDYVNRRIRSGPPPFIF